MVQVIGLGPHRLGDRAAPAWFFEKEKYGGILCDIGSHNFEQFLHYTGRDGRARSSARRSRTTHHPEHPELDDFGEAHVVTDNGATGYIRVDWFTPDGLRTWGDGRTFILGTDGYIELRKYIERRHTDDGPRSRLPRQRQGRAAPRSRRARWGTRSSASLILDCLDRTENAMTQEHAFKAAELSVLAQQTARVLDGPRVTI